MDENYLNHTKILKLLSEKYEGQSCSKFEYLDLIPEIIKKNKRKTELIFLFNWDLVDSNNRDELLDFLIESRKINSSLNVEINKSDDEKEITVVIKERVVSLKIDEQRHSVIVENNIGNNPKFSEIFIRDHHIFPIISMWEKISKIDEEKLLKLLKEHKISFLGSNIEIKRDSSKKTLNIIEKERTLTFIIQEDKNQTVHLLNSENNEKISYLYKIENGMKKIYERRKKFLINPNIPIDLICVEEKEETDPDTKKQEICTYYTLFFIASTIDIPKSLEDAILFYKYYLSRIISLKRYQIILVLSNRTELNLENRKFLKSNGIGLWRYGPEKPEPEILVSPIFNREKMYSDYKKKKKKPSGEKLPLFFEKYILEAVDGLVGFKPEQFGQRYVDRKIMGNIFELKNISYKSEISNLIDEHLTEKNDEYEFASEVFSQLWSGNIGIYYSEFLEIFEPSLQYIFADKREKQGSIYRDHYLHQLQVFLLGLPIIDSFWTDFKLDTEIITQKRYPNPELCWLIAASFHDMGYPVQKYDKWSEQFLNEVFKIKSHSGTLEFKSKFIDEHFLYCLGYLICELHCTHICKGKELQSNWLAKENDCVQFFYQQITDKKNHGLMSSISLLKTILFTSDKEDVPNVIKIKNKFGDFDLFLKEILCPSALAISLHDPSIWSGTFICDNKVKKVENFVKKVKFVDDPLSFLLIFCDTIHEWGRPNIAIDMETDKMAKKFYLKEFECNPKQIVDGCVIKKGSVKITLWTPNVNKKDPFFKRKITELQMVQQFLVEPDDILFEIILLDKNLSSENFEMNGVLS